MKPVHQSLLPLAMLALPAFAAIDSGGGKSTVGTATNHASIGEPFATTKTKGCTTANQPGLIEVLYPAPPLSTDDADGNGLPDDWEKLHFGMSGIDPEADADQDGQTNLMEYLAGTDPRSATCAFRPQGAFANGIFRLPFRTVPGRNYQIWATRDLRNWTALTTISGDGTVKTFNFDETTIATGPLHSPTHPSAYYFRIQILIP